MHRVLLADDQPDVLEALRLLLKGEGYKTLAVSAPADILRALSAQDFDALLMDLNYTRDTTSGTEGLDLLGQIQRLDSALPVVVMTAWGSVEGAVAAMRRGARDYLQKPWDNQRLLAILRTQIELCQALRHKGRLEGENRLLRPQGVPAMLGASRAMQPVLLLLERVGPSEANVLITGEHGTGKELVARMLHAASARADRALVPVNAGSLSEGVFESELFGHVRGAFTDARADRVGCFELADGGTLFLDEIANMPPGQQAKLLRVLQGGEFHRVGSSKVRRADVRVLCATNTDLPAEVRAGRFREDLLYRLNTVEIRLPPLRQRREDIPLLAAHLLALQARRYGRPAAALDPGAVQVLLDHSWPGNVRELEHAMERAVLLCQGEVVRAEDLGLHPAGGRPADSAAGGAAGWSGKALDELTLDQAERCLILRALARRDGNVSEAAELLGLSRSALYRRLQQHGIKGAG